ncbi:MAG: amidohydrolase family protein [Candidatus Binatus sp.]|uniref:N-acyl-D-amino-acid deacylase family protein n=1 Tax=Candidatus Binatus sp. TaxID=2811406 RepID=UPI00271A6462|nr:amidohydrolase family protein [Candidatus Binatus sp.]MDO8433731.1 amidohydrolase family protein [Candidatus Binatus sp.]
MAYDLLIKNGTVVDGTGAPRMRADIAVAGDRIAEIGNIREGAKRVIDASDLIVSPGFVDPHTHYDAQICWDPLISCTSWHGITSVVMGNCGVGVAPCKPESREIAAWDLTNVEAIPFESLKKGITWDWETFPEYLDAAERRGSAINLGFLAPLTPFRHYVMGIESMDRAATPEETRQIAALLSEAMAAGAMGFSTTTLKQHIGYQGSPLACRLASKDELKAYANVLKQHRKGAIEVALTKKIAVVQEDEYELLDMLLTESERPVTWLAMASSPRRPERALETLTRLEPLISRGGIPQVLCKPFVAQLDLRSPFTFADNDSWSQVFNQPVEVQKKIYADPNFRDNFRASLSQPHLFPGKWNRVEILEAINPALKQYEGKTVAEVAEMRGADGLDTFLDLTLEDDLQLQYTMQQYHEGGIQQLISDPRTMIGLSDGGAHVDMLCDAGYATYLLGNWVRKNQAMTLEFAIKRITSEPANFFGIRERGQLKKGWKADITVFDYNTVNSARRATMQHDLPGGGRRLVMPAEGIEYTVVNGRVSYVHGRQSGELAGQVIRSVAA